MSSEQQPKKVYFIGIGGIGMSAVAGLARDRGFGVSGSDSNEIYDPAKAVLDASGIKYFIGYDPAHLDDFKPEFAVAGAGVDDANPELSKAKASGLRVISYPEFLGELASEKKRIVVAGTHGKGTVAGLLGYALRGIEDSSYFVGAVLNNFDGNFYSGKGPHFIIEGDEYKSTAMDLRPKFSFYKPDLLLLNNIEYDHPDVFGNLEAYKKAFAELAASVPADGAIIFNGDDANAVDVIKNARAKKISFGFNEGVAVRAAQPEILANGLFQLKSAARIDGREFDFEVQSVFPGQTYAYDNLAACAVLLSLGIQPEKFASYVRDYRGVKRRYEIVYDRETTIIDDYAHHPTAVRKTLEATREKYPQRRIVCFFEPHTYSRTTETLPELATAFSSADEVFVSEVYAARESKRAADISGAEVAAEIKKHNANVHFVKDKDEAMRQYEAVHRPGDVIVVMAVGAFNTLAYNLKNKFEGQ